MAMRVMKVVRKFRRKRIRTMVTMMAPLRIASLRLPMACWMKSPWRKSTVASTPAGKDFWSSLRAVSIWAVRVRVSKPGDLVILMITPRLPLTLPSPRIGSTPQSTFARSPMVMVRSPIFLTTVLAMSFSSTVIAKFRTIISVVPVLMNPPVELEADSLAAVWSSAKVT